MAKAESKVHIPEISEPSWIGPIITFLIGPWTWPVAAFLVYRNLKKMWNNNNLKRYKRYILVIGDRPYVRLWELARATGKTKAEVRDDLQKMIDEGYLGTRAYVDLSTDCVVIDPERRPDGSRAPDFAKQAGARAAEQMHEREAQEQKAQETATVEVQPVSRPKKESSKSAEKTEDNYEKTLREIRELNERIADPEMSTKIDRIGELTASIFTVVKSKPDRLDEVRTFMSYYLPTTMKLLESYSLLEKQSYQGENIVGARKDIEKIIDMMVPAFEKQLDRLFQSEALDISTDIDVLEAMMAKDGLTEKEGQRLTLGR